MLMNRILTEKHGTEGKDWESGIEMFAREANGPDKYVRIRTISLRNDASLSYYFDITRAMRVVDKLLGQM
jgi:hypothetical protein